MERAAEDRATAHDVIQNAHDREIAIADQQSAQWQTLVKAFAQIIAAQLKQNASADAGQMLKHDVAELQ